MHYVLTKASHPGWEMKTDHIEHVRWMLEQHVCDKCKWTREQYLKHGSREEFDEFEEADYIEQGTNPYTFNDFFPENYAELSDQEKINLLMETACGCEYWLDETDEV